MKYTYSEDPCPCVLLEDVFDETQLDEVWKEIDFIRLSYQSDTGGARDDDGKLMKNNNGMFLNEVFTSPDYSKIMKHTTQQLFDNGWWHGIHHTWFGKMYGRMNHKSMLISEYSDGGYYHPHSDFDVFTALIWLWKEPKPFEGGDFYFVDRNKKITPENNSGIIFLGSEPHAVDEVKGDGRFVISTFITLSPDRKLRPNRQT